MGCPGSAPRGKPRHGAAAFCLGGKAGLGLIIVTHVAAMHGAGVSYSWLTLLEQEPQPGKEQLQPEAETPQTP